MNDSLRERRDAVFNDRNLIYVLAASVFLPYYLTAAVIVGMAIYLLVSPRTRNRIFVHQGSKLLLPFFGLAIVVPLIYQNWLGLWGGLGFIFILIIGLFVRSAMTRDIFPSPSWPSSKCCSCSPTLTGSTAALPCL